MNNVGSNGHQTVKETSQSESRGVKESRGQGVNNVESNGHQTVKETSQSESMGREGVDGVKA